MKPLRAAEKDREFENLLDAAERRHLTENTHKHNHKETDDCEIWIRDSQHGAKERGEKSEVR